jgi:hypothetical protein
LTSGDGISVPMDISCTGIGTVGRKYESPKPDESDVSGNGRTDVAGVTSDEVTELSGLVVGPDFAVAF